MNASRLDAQKEMEAARRAQEQSQFNQTLQFKRDKQNQLLSLLNQNKAQRIGGFPTVNAGPIWDQRLMQEEGNRIGAENAARAATNQRDIRERMGGLGYGSNSPLAMALQTNVANNELAATVGQQSSSRRQMTGENAKHRLAAQTAWEQAYAERQRPYFQMQNAIIAALANV